MPGTRDVLNLPRTRNLSDKEIELVAERVVAPIGERLAAPSNKTEPPETSTPEPAKAKELTTHRLAYTLREFCAELGISHVSVYRLEMHGLLRPNPALRKKIYSRVEVERLLALECKKW